MPTKRELENRLEILESLLEESRDLIDGIDQALGLSPEEDEDDPEIEEED